MNSQLSGDYRLAFFDVDGTLLGFNGEYTPRLKQAIRSAQDAGIKTAIASGRPKFATDFLIDELGLQDAGLFYTGALTYDPAKDRLLSEYPLHLEDVEALTAAARELSIYTEVCTRNQFYIERDHHIARKHAHHLRCQPQCLPFAEISADESVIKLLMAVSERDRHDHLRALELSFPHLIFAYAHLAEEPDWLFVSIISQAACKKAAFSELLGYHGVRAEQVIAFGDAHSDREFLTLAGTGVAMGNATQEVKNIADVVTAPVWEDGVAQILEQIV